MAYFRTYHEYSHAMHHDDRNRIFFIRADCHPFHRQHSDGSELAGRHLHARRISRSWAIRDTSAFLRSCFLFKSSAWRKRRLLHPSPVGNGQQVCPQREDFSRRERLLHRTSGTYRVRICAEYAFPAYVQFLTRPTLQAMGGRERPWCAIRPMRGNGNGKYAYPVGKYQILLHLPVELHVLALFHVELCRTAEWHTG